MRGVTPEHLLAEVDDVLRSMPSRAELGGDVDATAAWVGRAAAVISRWDAARTLIVDDAVDEIQSLNMARNAKGVSRITGLLQQARAALQMEVSPLAVVIQHGGVFDYFEAIRNVIAGAIAEVFFVDPYLDAEFVSRYLPHVHSGVTIRLLAREKLPTLLPAVDAFVQQHGATIRVRSARGFHDRYVFLDRQACYQSGASFKDGARTAPTTLTQITDGFQAMWDTYDRLWNNGKVER
jgi:hypothetical protein